MSEGVNMYRGVASHWSIGWFSQGTLLLDIFPSNIFLISVFGVADDVWMDLGKMIRYGEKTVFMPVSRRV